jgi:hypothetical protein
MSYRPFVSAMGAGLRAVRQASFSPPARARLSAQTPPHGFYSRRFDPQELRDLEAARSAGLSDEAAMLRVAIRRVFELASQADLSLQDWARTLDKLGAAAGRLARLLQAQKDLGEENGVSAALSEAMSDVIEELNLRNWGK